MRAERDERATIVTAEGDMHGAILRAEGDRAAAILKAEGRAREIDEVFQTAHRNNPDPNLLAYQYLQVLPQLAQGPGSTFWMVPTEVTAALAAVSRAFADGTQGPAGPGERVAGPRRLRDRR